MTTVTAAGRIDVISDAICPWCYIGKRHLERALDILEQHKLRFTVAWHPFQLNPDMPAEGVDRKQYRITKFGSLERSQQMDARITEVAAGVGIQFHLDKLTRTPNTLKAHRLIRLAGQKGVPLSPFPSRDSRRTPRSPASRTKKRSSTSMRSTAPRCA